jgi:hypothetical protein
VTTFRPATKKEFVPERTDFKLLVGRLGLHAKLIQENIEFEKRHKPLKIRDNFWWLKIPREWIVCFFHEGEWRSIRTAGSFWDPIAALPIEVREAHVFQSSGLHWKYYKRKFSYFKIEPWDIRDFSPDDRQALFRELKSGMKQRMAA